MQMCEAVYLFLEELDVPKIRSITYSCRREWDFLFATDHEQVWEEVMSLLDTFVEMLGEENVTFYVHRRYVDRS